MGGFLLAFALGIALLRAWRIEILGPCLSVLLLGACTSIQYTVDDGRPVDEKLLADIRTFGTAEQSLRPAIVRSGNLRDPECDKQWELPVAVASSQAWQAGAERVAWVRALKVDERLTVIAVAPGTDLAPGDRIVDIDGYHKDDAEAMIERLAEKRDEGRLFHVRTHTGKRTQVEPVEICRGRVLLAPPGLPAVQDYHWLMTVHPLEIFRAPITMDEALWIVLWTQGISEEAGMRMKTYHYGKKVLSTILTLASIASSVGAVANAAKAAAATVTTAATTTTSSVVAKEVASQVVQQVGKEVGSQLVKTVTDEAYKLARRTTTQAIAEAAANRAGLSGISWVAGTVFERADTWALTRIEKLGGDPAGAFTLHGKLALMGAGKNAFVFDHERLALVTESEPASRNKTVIAGILRATTIEEIYAPSTSGIDLLAIGDLLQDTDASVAASDVSIMPMESFPPEARGGFLEAMLTSSAR